MDDLSTIELTQSVQAQAMLRIKFGLFVAAAFLAAIWYWGPARPDTQVWEIGSICVAYLLYNLAAFYLSHHGNMLSPRDLVVATAVLDPLMLSLWLFVSGEASILFVGFYLFTILGFGFRVGRSAMHLCQAVSIVGFGLVSIMSPSWRERPLFEISHMVLLTVVPLYAGVLISKLKAAREVAVRASHAKSQLLAKVSHELRTPLTGIVSTASLIEAQANDPGSAERAVSIIKLALGLDLEIKQLLDLSRIEAGAAQPQRIAFEIRQVTDHIERTLGPIAAAKQVELAVEVDPAISGPMLGDAHALNSVLMNLAGNALKFTASGSVHVDLALLENSADAYRVRFAVQDTGIGIPQDLQQKIFEPFFQVETGPVRKYGGTGLGTSIALAHVRSMGGELHLESTPGKGSRFWFELQLARTAPEAAPPGPLPVRIVGGKRILVADDNRINLMLIREMLERDEHRVVAVDSGEGALQALASEDFDMVFLDFNMHDIDGATVFETYRFGRVATAPTFFVTADTSAMTASQLGSVGASGVIYKPVTFDKLRAAVSSQFPGDSAEAAAAPQRLSPQLRPVPVEYVDPGAIETLRDIRDTPEFLCQMVSEALLDIERIDAKLAGAILEGNLAGVHREAHALRGVCLSIGAVRLAAVADRLMVIGQRELESGRSERHAELRRTMDLSLAALDSMRQSLGSSSTARAG